MVICEYVREGWLLQSNKYMWPALLKEQTEVKPSPAGSGPEEPGNSRFQQTAHCGGLWTHGLPPGCCSHRRSLSSSAHWARTAAWEDNRAPPCSHLTLRWQENRHVNNDKNLTIYTVYIAKYESPSFCLSSHITLDITITNLRNKYYHGNIFRLTNSTETCLLPAMFNFPAGILNLKKFPRKKKARRFFFVCLSG